MVFTTRRFLCNVALFRTNSQLFVAFYVKNPHCPCSKYSLSLCPNFSPFILTRTKPLTCAHTAHLCNTPDVSQLTYYYSCHPSPALQLSHFTCPKFPFLLARFSQSHLQQRALTSPLSHNSLTSHLSVLLLYKKNPSLSPLPLFTTH